MVRLSKLIAPSLASAFMMAAANDTDAADYKLGGRSSQPIGHYEFCQLNRAECSVTSRNVAPEKDSDKIWRKIKAVNVNVNKSVSPVTDLKIYGKEEVWAYPESGYGDCEDYALEKRRQLIKAGLKPSSLLMTVVRKPDGEGHAVLTVRTQSGDYILDNLKDDVRTMSETGYTFLKRVDVAHSGRWVSIVTDENSQTASTNSIEIPSGPAL